jgi:prephenate dehydrogenase
LVQNVSDEILGTDVEVFGDLMLDVAEAYMAQQEYQESLNFLEKLVNSENWAKVKQKVLLGFFFNFQAMFWYFRTCY